MPKRILQLASSLKQLGDLQVSELDFIELLNKDIRELEISRSLKRWGNIRVMEWDFRTVIPAVTKLAHQEVDVVGLVRRTAAYRVMEWDFRSARPVDHPPEGRSSAYRLSPKQMQELTVTLKNFLHFVAVKLVNEPAHAKVKVRRIEPNVLMFRLVLTKRDVSMLIGMEGQTASAIRGVLKSAAGAKGVHALLQIHSHEEESALIHESQDKAGE